jgi:hypothetical protein
MTIRFNSIKTGTAASLSSDHSSGADSSVCSGEKSTKKPKDAQVSLVHVRRLHPGAVVTCIVGSLRAKKNSLSRLDSSCGAPGRNL